MSRAAGDRLYDIIRSVDLITKYAAGRDAVYLAGDEISRDAVLFRFVVLCEAAGKLDHGIQALAPEIPWPRIRAMRNAIVHSYWQVDFHILAETIAKDLPPLQAAAIRLMETLQSNQP